VKIRVIREIRGKKNASAYGLAGEMANRARLMGESLLIFKYLFIDGIQ